MVAGILTTDGYTVLASGTHANALQLARRHKLPIDLLICNLQHVDVLKFVRPLYEAHPRLRIVATDSVPTPPLSWLPREAQTSIAKPYALSSLLHTMRALLDGRTAGGPAGKPARKRKARATS